MQQPNVRDSPEFSWREGVACEEYFGKNWWLANVWRVEGDQVSEAFLILEYQHKNTHTHMHTQYIVQVWVRYVDGEPKYDTWFPFAR